MTSPLALARHRSGQGSVLTPDPFRPQEKVLHNIMPIFTFMGANIMRLDDSYSFQVINKTVQTVIPALIKVSAGLGLMTECLPRG